MHCPHVSVLGSPWLQLQVERVRLNYKSASMRRPSREQEVLHYQWFADLGSVEAQRAVGQIFSHGAMRNPEQALRYFRCPLLLTCVPALFLAWVGLCS